MALTLLLLGVLSGLAFIANSLLRTFTRRENIGFLDYFIATLVVVLTIAALVLNAGQAAPEAVIDQYVLWVSIGVFAFGLLLLLIDASRRQPLRRSRGLLGLAVGLLILAATFVVPFLAAYMTLAANPPAPTPEQTAEATEEPGGTPQLLQRTNRFNELFAAVREVVM
jgi:hypothetical protein